MKILGVDPGGTTGVCVWTDEVELRNEIAVAHRADGKGVLGNGTNGYLLEWGEISLGSVSGVGEGEVSSSVGVDDWRTQEIWVALTVWQLAQEWHVDVIACEDFILRDPKNKGGWSAARVALAPVRIQTLLHGYLFAGAADGTVPDIGIEYNQASLAKAVMTDERLKGSDLWVRGAPHARDAVRHAVTTYRRLSGGNVAGGSSVRGSKKVPGKKATKKLRSV